MFSSIASFIFGSSTSSDIIDREIKSTPTGQQEQEQRNSDDVSSDHNGEFDIIVHAIGIPIATQCSDNVTVTTGRQDRRGKHNKRNKQQKRKGQRQTQQHQQQLQLNKPTTSIPTPNSTGVTTASKPIITKLLTTSSDSFEEYSEEEDGWLFVEKEDEDDSSPRTDSEADVPVVRPSGSSTPVPPPNYNADHFSAAHPALPLPCLPPSSPSSTSSVSGYTGPRHLQQRNSLQKARNSGARGAQQRLQFTQLSPLRSVARNGAGAGAGSNGNILLAASVGAAPARLIVDTGLMAQSLYAVPIYGESASHNTSGSSVGSGASGCMDESWYVTPPPCFTSIGPIHMETSPFENLLIEHPSMSVYHSIRSAQEAAADGFANIDLGADESTTSRSSSDRERMQRRTTTVASRSAIVGNPASRSVAVRNPQAQTPSAQRTARAHIETLTATQLKQQLLAHKDQKHREKRERQSYGRSVLKRANLVHEHHNKRNWGGRADKQQQKLFSVNATRKY